MDTVVVVAVEFCELLGHYLYWQVFEFKRDGGGALLVEAAMC